MKAFTLFLKFLIYLLNIIIYRFPYTYTKIETYCSVNFSLPFLLNFLLITAIVKRFYKLHLKCGNNCEPRRQRKRKEKRQLCGLNCSRCSTISSTAPTQKSSQKKCPHFLSPCRWKLYINLTIFEIINLFWLPKSNSKLCYIPHLLFLIWIG